MEIVNPIAGSLAQSTAVTRQQSTDKSQQIRRAQALRKDVATASDSFEHQVESSEELTPVHDEQKKKDSRRRKRTAQAKDDSVTPDPESHIDVTG